MSIPSFCLPYVLIHAFSLNYIFFRPITYILSLSLSRTLLLSLSLSRTLLRIRFRSNIRLCYLHGRNIGVSRKYNI